MSLLGVDLGYWYLTIKALKKSNWLCKRTSRTTVWAMRETVKQRHSKKNPFWGTVCHCQNKHIPSIAMTHDLGHYRLITRHSHLEHVLEKKRKQRQKQHHQEPQTSATAAATRAVACSWDHDGTERSPHAAKLHQNLDTSGHIHMLCIYLQNSCGNTVIPPDSATTPTSS